MKLGMVRGALVCLLSWVAVASGQTTNRWTSSAGSAYWTVPGNWLILTNTSPALWAPTNIYPSGVGTFAQVTNDIGDQTIFLTNHITVGTLLWGDYYTGSLRDLRATNGSITFDTGSDGVQALFEHGTGDRALGNYGRYDDDFDAPITVADADGLFIDNFQNFSFHQAFNNDPARAFNGGGNDVTKGEDGALYFRGYVTNIRTFTARDGWVEFDPQGIAALQPGISNMVIGVAPGVVDTGANPSGVITNTGEGTVNDRTQMPYVSIIGVNTTNNTAGVFQPGTTNAMHLTMNRGVFRSYARLVTTTNNAPPPVYTGTITLNGSNNESFFIIENQDNGNYTTSVRQQIFAGQIVGTGGLTKMGTGEMTLITNNTFTGDLAINRSFDRGKGLYGGVGLRENGTLDGVNSITLNRDGQLFLDNSAINLSNRVNDAASIITRGRNAIEIMGNASAASYERFGAVSNIQGSLTFEFDKNDATPQSHVIDIATLYRTPGTIVSFQASDLQQGVFASNGPSNIVVNLLDGGASLLQVGSGGVAGSVTQSVVVGVFGGDGVDYQTTDKALRTPDRADEFMTVDAGRLRTLRADEMVYLGGRTTNALYISQASASADANVNIDFMSREELLGNTGLTNAGHPDLILKQVVGDATFNSIRLGIVRGTTAAPNEAGRTLVMLDGVKLTSESGMLLAGRDTGSTNGDLTPNGTMYLQGGTLDLDGVNGNREGIVHNNSGNSLVIRSAVEATNGFTKSGEQYVYLDHENQMGGVVNVAQSRLYLRDNNAVRGATEIVVQDGGGLYLSQGVIVTNVNFRAGERPYTTDEMLYSDGNHNVFGGDILIDNVDPQGIIVHEARINAGGQNSSLTLLGDIGIVGELASADQNLNDSQILRTSGSQGIINLYGVVGDRIVNGEAVPNDPTTRGYTRVEGGGITSRANAENDLLRFRMDGSGVDGNELVVNVSNAWNAAGRIYLEQGTMRFLGDGDFFNTNALRLANWASGQSGFEMALDGSDGNAAGTFLLTRDGQAFNGERWRVNPDYVNNTMTMGLEHTGPSNATVTIGNQWMDANPEYYDNRITFTGYDEPRRREFRLFSQNGYDSGTGLASTGNVVVIQSLLGQGYGTLTKAGNGVVTLLGQTNGSFDEANDIRYLTLLGGELVLDRSQAGYPTDVRRLTDNTGGQLTLAGGDLTYRGGGGANADERMSSNLFVLAGDSRVAVVGSPLGTTELTLANNNGAKIVRQRGGTVQFVEEQPGLGLANIRLGGTPANGRVGSWAAYGTNLNEGAYTWAAVDANSNLTAFTAFSTDAYGDGLHTDATVGTNLAAATSIASLRYSSAVGLDLGGNAFNVTNGGILIAPSVTAAAGMSNGFLTSSGGELIVQNYHGAGGSFAIGAAITGNVDVTFSGTGGSSLSGANTYTGITRLNGGTVAIDAASRLGAVTNLEMRGGTLFTTANTDLGTRKIVLGGDGGAFQTAAGTTNTIRGQIDNEDHLISATRANTGVGDLIKTGNGTLEIGGLNTVSNGFEGLTDIRGGTLLITRNNNNVLGSSKAFADGTIVRSGATLAIAAPTNFNNSSLYSREWLMFEQGSTLDIFDTTPAAYTGYRWNGVWDLRGDTTVRIRGDEFTLGSDGAGYLMGSGALIKEGDGMYQTLAYSPEFTGQIIVRDGNFWDYGWRNSATPNAAGITLGTADATNRGTVTYLVRTSRDGSDAVVDINQNITVLGHSADTRIGIYEGDQNDVVNYNGNIDLSGFNTLSNRTDIQFGLYAHDDVNSLGYGAATEFRQEYFVNLNGDITGGDKGIRTYLYQSRYASPTYNQAQDNGFTTTNELDMMAFFTFTGDNSGWTGYLETGNRTSTGVETGGPDKDKQHFVRFGNNDGAATAAIGGSNWVVMRHNATLQAYGSQVTIGSLFSDGDSGGADGYFGNQYVSNTFLENGGTVAGTFRIFETTNSTFDGVIRDGTYYSTTDTNLPSAALNIVKAGPGTLTLGGSNYYTGTTILEGGALRLSNNLALPGGIGATGGSSLLIMSNGVLGLGAGDFYRALGTDVSNVTWAAGGGFAAYGADRHAYFDGQTQSFTWGQANFVSGDNALMFGAVDSTHTFVWDHAIDLNGGDRRFHAIQGGTNVAGRITSTLFGSGGLVKFGPGTLELAGSNAYSGSTAIEGGSLLVTDANALPGGIGATGGTSALVLTNGGVLGLGFGDFSRALGSAGSNVAWTGSGGFAAYGADRIVNIGGQTQALTWGDANFVSGDNELVFGANDATHTVIFENDIAMDGTNRFRANDGLAYVDGRITGNLSDKSGSVGTFWKTGDGILELTGSNTWTGDIAVFGGQLLFSGAYSLPGSALLNISNFATVGISADFTRSLGTNSGEVVWTGSGGLFASGADRTVNLGGAGAGVTWGSNFFVPEIVDGSVLVLGAASSDATLNFLNSIDMGASNRTILVHNGSADIDARLLGVLDGDAGLVKAGNGVLALANANTYTGQTVIAGGMLSVSNLNALGPNPASYVSNHIFMNGGGLEITENLNLNSNQGIFLATNGGGIGVAATKTVTNFNILAGQGTFTKSGDGTLFMPTANLYTGATILAGGTLSISNENAFGPNPAASNNRQLTFNGGTLQATASFAIDDGNRNITVEAGGGTFDVLSGVALTNARSINTTAYVMGGLNKTGAGAFENRGNTYLSDFNMLEGDVRFGAGTIWISNAMNVVGGGTFRQATTTYINQLNVSNANLIFEGGDLYVRDFRPDFASMPSNGLVFAASGGYKYLFQDLSGTNADVTLDIPKLIYGAATDPNSLVFGRSGGTNVAYFNVGSIEWTNRRVFRAGAMTTAEGADASIVNINGPISFTNGVASGDERYVEARSIYGGVVNINSNIIVNQGLDLNRNLIFQGNGEIRLNSDVIAVDTAGNPTGFTNYLRLDGWRNLKVTVDNATRFGDARRVDMYAGSVLKFNYDVTNSALGYPGAGLFYSAGGADGRGWYLEFGVQQSSFYDPFISAQTGLIARAWTGIGGNLSNAVYTGGFGGGQNIYLQTNASITEGTLNAPTVADVGANTLYLGILHNTNTYDLNSLDAVYKGVSIGAVTLQGGGRNSADYPATDEGYSGTLNARTGQDLEVGILGEVFVEPVTTNLAVSDNYAHFNSDTGVANFRGPGNLVFQQGNSISAFGGTATNINRIGVSIFDGFGFESQNNTILDLVNDYCVNSNINLAVQHGLVRVRSNGALGAVTGESNTTLIVGAGGSFWADNANNNDNANFAYNRGKLIFQDDGGFYTGTQGDRFDATTTFLNNISFSSNSILILNDAASHDTVANRTAGFRRFDTAGYTYLFTNMNIIYGDSGMRTALVANSAYAFALADGKRVMTSATGDANIDRIYATNGAATVEVDILAQAGASNVMFVAASGRTMNIRTSNVATTNALWTTFGDSNQFFTTLNDSAVRSNAFGTGTVNLLGGTNLFQNIGVAARSTLNIGGWTNAARDVVSSGTATFSATNVVFGDVEARGVTNISASVRFYGINNTMSNVASTGGGDVTFGNDAGDTSRVYGDLTMRDVQFDNPTVSLDQGDVRIFGNIYTDSTSNTNTATGQSFSPAMNLNAGTNIVMGSVYMGPTNGSLAGSANLRIGNSNSDVTIIGGDLVLNQAASRANGTEVQRGDLVVSNNIIVNSLGIDLRGVTNQGAVAGDWSTLLYLYAHYDTNFGDGFGVYDRLHDGTLALGSDGIVIKDYGVMIVDLNRTNLFAEGYSIGQKITIDNTGPNYGYNRATDGFNMNIRALTNIINGVAGTGSPLVTMTNIWMGDGSYLRLNEDNVNVQVGLFLDGSSGNATAVLSEGASGDDIDLLNVASSTPGQGRILQLGTTNLGPGGADNMDAVLLGTASEDITLNVQYGSLTVTNGGGNFLGLARAAGVTANTNALIRLVAADPVASFDAISGRVEVADYGRLELRVPRTNQTMTVSTPIRIANTGPTFINPTNANILLANMGGSGTTTVNITNVTMANGSWLRVDHDGTQSPRVGLELEGTAGGGLATLSKTSGPYNDNFDLLDVRSDVSGQARTLQIGSTNSAVETSLSSTLRGIATEDVTLDVLNGRLTLAAGADAQGSVIVHSGSTFDSSANANELLMNLAGNGTYVGNVTVSNIFAPGLSPGTLTVTGDVTFLPTSVLNFELSGTSTNAGGGINDLLQLVGSGSDLSLDGILNVAALDAFTNSPFATGAYWTIMTYTGGLLSTNLALGALPTIDDTFMWMLDTSTDGEVRLAMVIPEPSTWLLLVLGIGAGMVVSRRRRQGS